MKVNRRWLANGIIILAALSIPAWLFYINWSEKKHFEEMGSGLHLENDVQNINQSPLNSDTPATTTLSEDASNDDALIPRADSTKYAGPFIFTGEYDISSADMITDIVCFHADEKTGKLLHRDKDDQRDPWFCFQNNKVAQEMLKINSAGKLGDESCISIKGEASITVKNHYYDRRETETFDLATLTAVNKVIQKPTCVPAQ